MKIPTHVLGSHFLSLHSYWEFLGVALVLGAACFSKMSSFGVHPF